MKNIIATLNQVIFSFSKRILSIVLLFCLNNFFGQQTYTFTSAGASGSNGPTQTQINTSYTSTSLNGLVTCTNGIQTWTVPASGLYLIDVRGASGGSTNSTYNKAGGTGSRMIGTFNLLAGNVLNILVGQQGVNGCGTGGGGGGSYVVNTGTILIAAGGGGGASSDQLGGNSTTVTAGTNDNPGGSIPGGTNGSGGSVCNSGGANHGGGGGGYLGNGATSTLSSPGGGGLSFTNGGTGGTGTANGGFGGGGGGTNCTVGGGGGGGYSGGAGGQQVNYCMSGLNRTGGGGGGSFNAGISQTNTPASNVGDGRVIITSLCNINLVSSGSNSTSPTICSGTSLTLTTNAVSNYSWSTGASSSSLVVTPSVTTTYSLVATSVSNCIASSAITITVSAGLPTLSINTSTNQICLGKSVTLTATGALSYSWTGGVINGSGFAPPTSSTYIVTGQNGCGTSTAAVSITVAPLSVTAIVSPTIICIGKTATLTASSAVSGYTWFPGNGTGITTVVSPNVNTIYSVSASDGTCSGSATVSLLTLQIPTITISASATLGVCEGYPVNLTANGGINYTWSPGNLSGASVTVNPTAPTLYSVVANNSLGCTSTANQIVITTPSPTINIVASVYTICAGDPVNIITSGASTYTWSNGSNLANFTLNPQSNITLTVSGSLNGCDDSETLSINVFSPTITISGPTSICAGKSATLTASGASTYLWNTGSSVASILVSPNLTTVYTLSTTSSNGIVSCPATTTTQLLVLNTPTISAVATRTSMCKNETATITASGANTYSWNSGNNTPSIIATSSLVGFVTYTVMGTNANNCTSTTSILFKINACTGINEFSKNNLNVNVYPNPNSGDFFVESDFETNLILVNQIGQTLKSINLSKQNDYKVSITNLSNGVYFLIGLKEGKQVELKIIVNK